uniref:beta-N-acetylhexosaminidase n=1 Tax=uncultured prokaryote TaxID=198431 RepID=A0A0H5Q253_9ZZZZ|nr:hypothetical protein [uncultured prokaryote]
MNKIFEDREFGAVAICKNARSRRLSIRVRERQNRSGARISITIPYRISYQDAIDYLDSHRDWVRDVLRKQEKAVEDAAREGMAVLRIGDGTTIPTLTSDIVFKVVQGLTGKVNVVTSGRSVSKQVYSGAVYPVKDGDAGFFGIGENASRPADVPCRTISFPAQWLDKDGVVTDDSCRKFLGRVLVEVLRNEAKSYLAGRLAEQFLQSYVTARIQKFVNDHGRKIIGWDEILEGELAPGATVMSWRGAAGGIEAAKKGFDVIMTPNTYMYFDYYQSKQREVEPLGIGGHLPIDTVYACNPCADIPEEAQSHILGVQANLWTEYIATPEHLEYMLLPRMAALSEVQWCSLDNKDFERFKNSLHHEFDIYDVMGLNYSKAVFGEYGMDYVKIDEPVEEKSE